MSDADIDHVDLRVVPPFDVAGKIAEWSGKNGKLTLRPLGWGDEVEGEIAGDGTFRLRQAHPNWYRVTIAELPENTYIKRLRLGANEMADAILDLRGGASGDPLMIELSTGAARMTGTVSDAQGPAAGALVVLFPVGTHPNERRVAGHAKADGTFAIGGLAPGKYAILAMAAGEPEAVAQYDSKLETVEIGEGETANRALTISVR